MPFLEDIPDATPLGDISELIPSHITTRSELNEWEAANILKAVRKYLSERQEIKIDIPWLKRVHKDMFDESWEWAGKFRQYNLSLGIDWHRINDEMQRLVHDIVYWEQTKTLGVFEQSVRIHHRLVQIHPFANGNGRHARLISDIFLFNHESQLPKGPTTDLIDKSDVRNRYIAALKDADGGKYATLEKFTAELMK